MSAPSGFEELVVAALIEGGWPPSVARSLELTRAKDGRFVARLGAWSFAAVDVVGLVQALNSYALLFPDAMGRER